MSAGYKVWTAGDVLTAADVNNYLGSQVVMVFADSAARSSAIATATAGMVSYLTDTGSLEVYGTAWAAVSNPGDITAVTAGYGLSGGGTSGAITVTAGTVITSSTATAYTIVTADAGTYLQFTDAATVTLSTATDFGIGQQVTILADGTALSIISDGATMAGAGTSTTTGTFTVGNQYEAVSILATGTDEYRIIGNITAA